MAPRKKKDNDMTEEERWQVKQLFDLDFLLAAKKTARGLFTPPEINMDGLVLLLIRRGLIFPTDIADELGLSGSRTTFLLGTLSREHLVNRSTAEFNRRKVICELTVKGKKKADSLNREWKQNILRAIQKMDNEGFVDMMTNFIRMCLEEGDKDEG